MRFRRSAASKPESTSFMHATDHCGRLLLSVISQNPPSKKSKKLKTAYRISRSEPVTALEENNHRHTDDEHRDEYQRIPERPVQLRHEIEVHTVDSGDHCQRQHDRRDQC